MIGLWKNSGNLVLVELFKSGRKGLILFKEGISKLAIMEADIWG